MDAQKETKETAPVIPPETADATEEPTGVFKLKEKIQHQHGNNTICSLLITHNNKLVTGDHEGFINIFKYSKEKGSFVFENQFKAHEDVINCIRETRNENEIITCSCDKTLKRINIKDSKVINVFNGHTDLVYSAIILNNNDVASASADKLINIWSPQGELKSTLKGHSKWVSSLSLIKNGAILVSGGDDGQILFWDEDLALMKDKTLTGVRSVNYDSFLYLEDSDLLIVGGFKVINIINLKENKIIKCIKDDNLNGWIYSIKRLSTGDYFVGLWADEKQFLIYSKEFNFKTILNYNAEGFILGSSLFKKNQIISCGGNGHLWHWSY